MHLHPQAHGFHSFPIPIFDVSVQFHYVSLHHLLHHFCLKLHHFPIKYDTFAFSSKVRNPLKTLVFQAFPEVLKSCKHKFNKFLLVCFHCLLTSCIYGLFSLFYFFIFLLLHTYYTLFRKDNSLYTLLFHQLHCIK